MSKQRAHRILLVVLAAAAAFLWVNRTAEEGGMKADRIGTVEELPPAPEAPQSRREITRHGRTLIDPFAGLRDEDYPTVDDTQTLDYLRAENAYFEAAMKPVDGLVETLFAEFEGRLEEDERSVPARDGDYYYYWRYEPGAQYRKWWRRPAKGGEAVVILDELARAGGHDFYDMGALTISPDGRYIAWSEDLEGSERYRIFVRDLQSGKIVDEAVSNSTGWAAWAADSASFFYTVLSEEWRPYQIRYHKIGADAADDRLVYEEKDTGFFIGLGKSQSRKYVIIAGGDNVTSEVRVIPADSPETEPVLIAARKENHQYEVDHAGGTFYIRTNDTHKNFRVVTAPEARPGPEHWVELIAPSDEVYIRRLTSFRNFLVIEERLGGLDQIRLRDYDGGEHRVAFPEEAYRARLGNNPEFEIEALRINYESMVTPDTVFDYDFAQRKLVPRKVQEIPSGYEADKYTTERLWARARDGVEVPISIVYRKDFPRDGSGRLHLYGYGAYGSGRPPNFSFTRLSLLDRGFAYAIAHVRGGDEMGYHWYEDGKLFNRTNAFHDFIDVAEHLIGARYAAPGNISISGGSAGGTLIGYVLNERPELWRAAVAHVPFVDVLNTILDDSLPLTPIEWPEWGNPITDERAFEYILSYSPYNNVKAQDYPPIMVTAGLHDPRVTYWEPAKWVARLRTVKTDDNLLVLKTNMGAGHRGLSGRYKELYEIAEEFAFVLMAFGERDQKSNEAN